MSGQESNSLVTTQELDAAIAEVESLTPAEKAAIPSLDDGSENNVVPIPVPTLDSKPEPTQSSPDPSHTDVQIPQSPPAAPVPPAERPLGRPWQCAAAILRRPRQLLASLPFLKRRSPAPAPTTPTAQPGEPGSPSDGHASLAPASFLLRLLDAALELINRPFHWVPPPARHTLGLVGVATILVSLLALHLIPLLLPNNDAISFIRQKQAELVVAPLDQPADNTVETSP